MDGLARLAMALVGAILGARFFGPADRVAGAVVVGVGLAIYLGGWSVVVNLSSRGNFAPLPYCPLLNPLDLAQGVVLVGLWRYWRTSRVEHSCLPIVGSKAPAALAALTFLWLNAIVLRTLHQWFGVAYGWDALLDSTLVQTSLSIFWALLSFVGVGLLMRVVGYLSPMPPGEEGVRRP